VQLFLDAERRGMHSHAERGNEKIRSRSHALRGNAWCDALRRVCVNNRRTMMKLITSYFFILLIFWNTGVFAGSQRQIELTDGSVITGEIVSFSDGVYTIKSNHLGILKIEDSKVRSIDSGSRDSNDSNASFGDLQGLQNLIMSSPDLMNTIMSLQDDPDFKAALQNPEVMRAVSSGDINTLLSNPLFMKLIENPKVKEIAQEVERR